jgi:hypothetical protein
MVCAIVAGAGLLGSPGTAIGGERSGALSETQSFSATAGTLLGAASACEEISGDRISIAAEKVALALVAAALSDDDLAVYRRVLAENIEPGKEAVRSGYLSCPRVAASLAMLERLGDGDEEEPD